MIIIYFVLELIVIGYGYLQYSESPKCRLSDIEGMSLHSYQEYMIWMKERLFL